MKHILVFAYQISPYAGSEFAVAWNYVMNMSRTNKLTVLYGISEGWLEIGNVRIMTEYLNHNRVENVEFIPVLPDDKVAEKLSKLIKSKYAYYQFYSVYKEYHKLVGKVAKDIISRQKIDVIHYLGPIGYREPGYLRQLGVPYIWGPIGGISSAPMRILKGTYSLEGALEMAIKEGLNVMQYTFSKRIRNALKNSDLVLVNHQENAQLIKKITGRDDLILLPENGITELYPLNEKKFDSDIIECIWVGAIFPRKSLYTLMKALTLIDRNTPIHINIVGTGPQESKLKEYANTHGIDHFIKWHGNIERKKVFELFDKSHLHIITSLKEGHTTVIWEAMSKGVPTMSLQHSGMADTVNEKNGILIKVTSFDSVCKEIALQLTTLAKNPSKLKELAKGVLESRSQYTWDNRANLWNQYYDLAIETHKKKQREK